MVSFGDFKIEKHEGDLKNQDLHGISPVGILSVLDLFTFRNLINLQGVVPVRFLLLETNFTFLCSHLASMGKEGYEKHRNSGVAEIFSRTCFPRVHLLDIPRKLHDHE